jgi:type VI protein secretion system component VasK
MGLQDSVVAAFHSIGATVRRNAIGYGICALCAVAVLILATWASVLALVPLVGSVYAPLIVAGFFVLVIATTMLWLQYAGPRRPASAAMPFLQADAPQRQAQFAQIAMIIEAVMLGYTLSRRSRR